MTTIKARDWRQIRFPRPLWLRMEDEPDKKPEDDEYAALYGVIDVDEAKGDRHNNNRKNGTSTPSSSSSSVTTKTQSSSSSSSSSSSRSVDMKSSGSQVPGGHRARAANDEQSQQQQRRDNGKRDSDNAHRDKGSGSGVEKQRAVEQVDAQRKENVQYLRETVVKETPQAQHVQPLTTGGFVDLLKKNAEEESAGVHDSDLDNEIMALKNSVKNLEVATLEQEIDDPASRMESSGSEILRKLKEMDALFHPEDKTVPWNDFYRALSERVPALREAERMSPNGKTDVSWILKLVTGAHINNTLHYSKYRIISTFFGPLVSDENLKALLDFYRDKVTGRSDYSLDKKIGWFQGVLLPMEEEALLNSVTPQTFIVTFGSEESTLVFAYNDFDDDTRKTTSTFLISIVYNPDLNKFSGMDMENPDSDEDVEYATLYEIVALFKKLGFRPLGCHVLFGSG